MEEYHLYAPNAHAKPAVPGANDDKAADTSNEVTADNEITVIETMDTVEDNALPQTVTDQPSATPSEEEPRIIIKVSQQAR